MSPARYLFTLYHSSRRSLGTANCMRAPTYLLTLARCARNPFVHCPTSLQTRPSAQKIDSQEQRKKKKKKKDGGRTGSYLRTRFPPCLARTRDRNANPTTSHETPKLGATRRSGAQPMRLMPWGASSHHGGADAPATQWQCPCVLVPIRWRDWGR